MTNVTEFLKEMMDKKRGIEIPADNTTEKRSVTVETTPLILFGIFLGTFLGLTVASTGNIIVYGLPLFGLNFFYLIVAAAILAYAVFIHDATIRARWA